MAQTQEKHDKATTLQLSARQMEAKKELPAKVNVSEILRVRLDELIREYGLVDFYPENYHSGESK